jgi:hypothetical protein
VNPYRRRRLLRRDREKKAKQAREKIEQFFNEREEFKNGKLFRGVSENAILVGRNGDIGLFNESFPDCKMIKLKDIKSIKSASQDSHFQCVFKINDFDDPVINIDLAYCWDKDDRDSARASYDKIKATIDSLKKG